LDLKKEEQQRKEFCDILLELAKNQEVLQNEDERRNMYKRLENLYYVSNGENFRHFYSDIFTVLTQIKHDPSKGDINILGQNLSVLRENYSAQNFDNNKLIDIGENIKKLYDHVSLDIARISYSDAGDRIISGEQEISDVKSKINQLQEEIERSNNAQESIGNKLEQQQKEYIAILGIFAAVVLAFTGGISFSTSVLENIHSVSVYRLVLISLVIGFVLINVIFGLFSFIHMIVYGFQENKKNTKPWILLNVIIGILVVITIIAWFAGVVETRNGVVGHIFYACGEHVTRL